MMIKKYWIGVYLAAGVFVSCGGAQNGNKEAGIDSLVTRTKAQIWTMTTNDDANTQQLSGLIKTRVYATDAFTEKGGADPVSKWQSVLAAAKQDSVKIYMSKNIDEAAVKSILSSNVQQSKHISTLVSNLKGASANGVALSFGDVSPQDTPRYLTYVKNLAEQLHNGNFELAVVVPPVNSLDINALSTLATSADYLLFDFSNVGEGGTRTKVGFKGIEQYDLVNAIAHTLTSTIDPRKLMLILSADDPGLSRRCDFIIQVGLGGVVINYSGKSDTSLNKILEDKFVYVDTVWARR